MESIAALSLASNVIQVVDFSARLVSKGYKVYKSVDGSLAENIDAEIIAKDLNDLNGKLRLSYEKNTEKGVPLADDDQALINLCEKCTVLADELLQSLEGVKVFGRHRKWKSARQALKSVINKDDLAQFSRRLDSYRNEMIIHITVSLRERIDLISLQQSNRFNYLDSGTKDIMRAIVDTRTDVINALSNPRELTIGQHDIDQPLHEAVHKDDRLQLRSLLNQRGTDVNSKDANGQTALHLASATGRSQLVRTLLNNYAKTEAEDNNGRTALHVAAIGGHWHAVRGLLMKGANKDIEDDDGHPPIHFAGLGRTSDHEACVWMLTYGHDVSARDDHGDSLLLFAACKGIGPLVSYLPVTTAEIEVIGGAGWTPLIAAAAHGHDDTVRRLLDRGARVEATDGTGSTALIRAAWRGHIEVVRVLLDRGANIEAENHLQHHSMWTSTEKTTALSFAIVFRHGDIVRLLLEKGARVSGVHLLIASECGNIPAIILLLDGKVNIEHKSPGGTTALMLSAYYDKPKVAEALVLNGADTETRRDDDATALWIASESGHSEVVKVLLKLGADIESQGGGDRSAYSILTKAAQFGHLSVVQILLDKGARLESKNSGGNTALHEAAWHDHLEIAEMLLDKGANIESRDAGGFTPLIRASWEDKQNIVWLFLRHGANIEAKNTSQKTALAEACTRGCVDMTRLLLIWGADVESRDREGRTPLMHAAFQGHEAIVRWLLQYGAFRGAKDTAGSTALSLAVSQQRDGIVKMLG